MPDAGLNPPGANAEFRDKTATYGGKAIKNRDIV
jgi:hypothetical protein